MLALASPRENQKDRRVLPDDDSSNHFYEITCLRQSANCEE
jgi:hypothetical protein